MNKTTQVERLCEWVIAYDYYDGPMAGIGLRSEGEAFLFFKAVAWDEEHCKRVFALTDLQRDVATSLRSALERFEPKKEPFWFPSGMADRPEVSSAWEAVLTAALDSKIWVLVESHDLLDSAAEMSLSIDQSRAVGSMVRADALMDISGDLLINKFVNHLQVKT